jgi:hypothetical protein
VTDALKAELKLAEEVTSEVKTILSQYKFSDEEWSTVVIAFIDQGLEHHAAILLMLRSGLIGSAFAMVRPLVEIAVRGTWITTSASEAEVKKFREKDQIDLSFGQMSAAIDKTCGIDFFAPFKIKSWDALNSYTHTGILQLGRRFTGHQLKPSYTEGEQIEVVRTSTVTVLMLVRPFLVRHGQNDAAKAIDALGQKMVRKN